MPAEQDRSRVSARPRWASPERPLGPCQRLFRWPWVALNGKVAIERFEALPPSSSNSPATGNSEEPELFVVVVFCSPCRALITAAAVGGEAVAGRMNCPGRVGFVVHGVFRS